MPWRCSRIPSLPRRSSSRSIPAAALRSPGASTTRFRSPFLDTGASDVSIPDEVARELERAGKLDRGDFIGTRTYVLADGSKVPSRRVLLRELTVGGQTVSNVTASIGRPGSPPLLGQSFLSKFASWTLDNERNVLVLQTKGGTAASPDSGRGGGPYGAFAHDEVSGRYGGAGTRPRRRGPTKRRSRAAPPSRVKSPFVWPPGNAARSQ